MNDTTIKVAAGIVGTLVVAGIVGVNIARVSMTETHTECTVQEREDRALASLDKRDPRVYTDCGVFVVADELGRLHFNAADVYADLEPGGTYTLTTVGWRFGLFSWFPNVIEVQP